MNNFLDHLLKSEIDIETINVNRNELFELEKMRKCSHCGLNYSFSILICKNRLNTCCKYHPGYYNYYESFWTCCKSKLHHDKGCAYHCHDTTLHSYNQKMDNMNILPRIIMNGTKIITKTLIESKNISLQISLSSWIIINNKSKNNISTIKNHFLFSNLPFIIPFKDYNAHQHYLSHNSKKTNSPLNTKNAASLLDINHDNNNNTININNIDYIIKKIENDNNTNHETDIIVYVTSNTKHTDQSNNLDNLLNHDNNKINTHHYYKDYINFSIVTLDLVKF